MAQVSTLKMTERGSFCCEQQLLLSSAQNSRKLLPRTPALCSPQDPPCSNRTVLLISEPPAPHELGCLPPFSQPGGVSLTSAGLVIQGPPQQN